MRVARWTGVFDFQFWTLVFGEVLPDVIIESNEYVTFRLENSQGILLVALLAGQSEEAVISQVDQCYADLLTGLTLQT